MKLSVIIPAYNESKRIVNTLNDIDAYLKKQSYSYEILVVSDGSTDNTAEVVNNLVTKISGLKFIDNHDNRGKGGVVKQGMLEASGDVRLFMDADNSTKISEIEKFLPYFEQGFDIVIGSRRIKGSQIAVHQPIIRDLLGGIFRLIVHTIVPLHVTDSQCGFKAFSSKASEAIFPKQTIMRWAFDVEILALARKMKFKIQEAPILWQNDEASNVKLSGMIRMLFEVLQVRLNLIFGVYK